MYYKLEGVANAGDKRLYIDTTTVTNSTTLSMNVPVESVIATAQATGTTAFTSVQASITATTKINLTAIKDTGTGFTATTAPVNIQAVLEHRL